MTASDEGSRSTDGSARARRWRRLSYTAAASSLLVAALAVVQWTSADDSRDRWSAGVQCVLAAAVAVGSFVRAKNTDK